MTTLHIYRAGLQPGTRFKVELPGRAMWIKRNARRAIYANCCGKKRYARNLQVAVYYDCVMNFCREGTGCKRRK